MSLRLHLAYKNIKRLRDIVAVFTRHGFRPFMERLHLTRLLSVHQKVFGKKRVRDGESAAVGLRLAIEELGPTFIKLGQILSTRPDILPQEFIIELLKLQDDVAPFPFKDAVAIIEGSFKRPAAELFSRIEETPIAAASISQVHRAVTASGDEVVIKVQRPGIAEVVDTDIVILGYLARLALKYIPESAQYDPVGIVDEFSRVIRKEMDFTLEASYIEKFRTNFAGDGRVMIPRVYWEYSGHLVLTMERVEGIKADRVDKLRERGIDTRKVAHLVVDVFFKQVFDFGLFHGDLHSGNIFVVGPERIALVDFGIVGRLDKKLKAQLAEVFIYLVSEDFEGLIKVYRDMGILPEHIDRRSFEREYYDLILHYFGRPFKYVSVGEVLMDYIRLAARHGVMMPMDLLLFDKCLIELEGLSRLLFPEANILEESGVHTSKLFMERYSPTAMGQEALQTLSEAKSFISKLPGQVEHIMDKIAGDRLRIEFVHRGLEDFMGEMDRSSNRLTFGIIMAALVIGSSLVISTDTAPRIWGYAAIGVLGFLIASLLGFWLAFQILRSGKF